MSLPSAFAPCYERWQSVRTAPFKARWIAARAALAAALLLLGCDDSGSGPDGGNPGVPAACLSTAVQTLMVVPNQSLQVTGATSGSASSLEPQGLRCVTHPQGQAQTTGPEVVYQLQIAGTATYELAATTENAATRGDTVLYLQTLCGGGTELACHDDITAKQHASKVVSEVRGGERYYLVVDSFDPTASSIGPFGLTLTMREKRQQGQSCDPQGIADLCASGLVCTPPTGGGATCESGTAPTLDSAEAVYQDDGTSGPSAAIASIFLYLTGSDADGDVRSVRLTFVDQSGVAVAPLSPINPDYLGMRTTFARFPVSVEVPAPMTSRFVDVEVADSTGKVSNRLRVPLWVAKTRGSLDCAAFPLQCAHLLVCKPIVDNNACVEAVEAGDGCGSAQQLTSGVAVDGMLAATGTADRYEGSCVYLPGGPDRVFRIHQGDTTARVLAVTTDFAETVADTYVYVRSTCVDPTRGGSELACNDDIARPGNSRSSLVTAPLPQGDYFIFVDVADGQRGPFGAFRLRAELR